MIKFDDAIQSELNFWHLLYSRLQSRTNHRWVLPEQLDNLAREWFNERYPDGMRFKIESYESPEKLSKFHRHITVDNDICLRGYGSVKVGHVELRGDFNQRVVSCIIFKEYLPTLALCRELGIEHVLDDAYQNAIRAINDKLVTNFCEE